jgi:hypothetical protein
VNVPARLAAFAAVLAITFGAAYAAGAAVGPVGGGDPVPATTTSVPGGHGSHP